MLTANAARKFAALAKVCDLFSRFRKIRKSVREFFLAESTLVFFIHLGRSLPKIPQKLLKFE